MSITWRDTAATTVTAALVTSYIGLAQQLSWAPVTSVRWFALLFLVAGQITCTIGAADAMASGTTKGAGFVLGPLTLVATLAALVTGSVTLMGVAVVSLAALWVLTTSRHILSGHHRRPVTH